MLSTLLEILAEFGLLREDYKHHKKITKKEKEDGKKRPFQRYFLQPSTLLVIVFLTIGSIGAFAFFTYRRTSIFPERTKTELTEMAEWAEKWKTKYGQYPNELDELIGNSPLKQAWRNDAWDRPYKYAIMKDGKAFSITSAGLDGKFGSEDDINTK